MKKVITVFLIGASINLIASTSNRVEVPENPYQSSFQKAYSIYSSVPKGFLEAIAYTQTRFYHLDGSQNSCIGLPKALTVMGLIEDGKGYFRENLLKVSLLSGFSVEDIKNNPESSILAYASAFQKLQQEKNIFGTERLERYKEIFIELSELPLSNDIINDFAMQAHLYQLYWFLSQPESQNAYRFPDYKIDLRETFKENYAVLSAGRVLVTEEAIYTESGAMYKNQSTNQITSADYPPAIWNPAASCNYSSRGGTAISAVTIHDTEGSYAGAISWFKNCSAQVSAHYVLRSSDGQVTQMVLEADKAWHVGTENPYTIGIEHEGYMNTGYNWYTTAMYNSSAALVKDICNSGYGINPLRTGFWPWLPTTNYSSSGIPGSCTKIKGHQHYPNQTHTDPGQYWNWDRYYKLVNSPYTITATYTASSGTFYDSGGSGGNYSNDERKLYLFTQAGATNITLNFTSFGLENTWDYMYIYNGGSVWSPLVGYYTGTNSPGNVSVNNDSVLVEFRSDCATTDIGWAANYTITATGSATDNIAPVTVVSAPSSWVTTNFTTTITDTDNSGGSGIQKGYYQVIEYNGNYWDANRSRGFFADNFDSTAIRPYWNVVVGNWSQSGGALIQSDESSSTAGNTNIYAFLDQTLSNRYLYEFDIKLDGTGTNRRGGFHFFCDTGWTTNRSNSYFVWFRLDDQKFQLYKVVNNSFGTAVVDIPLTFSANTWYNVKVIYDRITGEIWTYWNNQLINKYQDPSPHNASNGKYVSFRSGNAVMNINQLKVYRSRVSGNVTVLVGPGNTDLRYQNPNPSTPAGRIKSIAQDNADNISAIVYQDVNVDWTPPSAPSPVNDGKTTDINIACTKDSLSANWGTSTDPHSGLSQYWYSVGTSAGSTNIINWTNAWANTLVTVNIPSIAHGTTYYFSVKAENGAGLQSTVVSSNGQLVDTTCVSTSIASFVNQFNQIMIFPNPVKDKIQITAPNTFDVEIYNTLGSKVYSAKNLNNSLQLNISDWAKGIYLIKIKDTQDKIHIGKIIKE
ncbi:MAG: N-acetylmuramoyl-L-alanine amidase [Bacteroidia bacterium]|nr:N-acetylmuramoyl-L-alanine amidase [Bacteroidia bacterium]